MPSPRILAFAGSLRRDSYNKRLLRIAVQGAREAGAEVTLIDLADYPLPLFNEDIESGQGPPRNALLLRRLMTDHQGLLIASPEYNTSVTAVLKNTIDWVSRPLPGQDSPWKESFLNKVAVLLSAAPGPYGGQRGLAHLRSILGNIAVVVLPYQACVPFAGEAFDESGDLIEKKRHRQVVGLGRMLAVFLSKLGPDPYGLSVRSN